MLTNASIVVGLLAVSWVLSGLHAKRSGGGSAVRGWLSLYAMLAASTASDHDTAPVTTKPRLPARPLFGSVKTFCPACQKKSGFKRDAVCTACRTVHVDLADHWGLADDGEEPPEHQIAVPEYEDAEIIELDCTSDVSLDSESGQQEPVASAVTVLEEEPEHVDAADEQFTLLENHEYDPVTVPDSHVATTAGTAPALSPENDEVEINHTTERPRIAVDPSQNMPSFDDLPSRPKRGSVKTVCPTCQTKTRHVKDASCRVCGELNGWLAQRWGLLEPGQAAVHPRRPEPADPVEPAQPVISKVSITQPGPWCNSCQRVSRPDLYNACMFCGTPMEGNAS